MAFTLPEGDGEGSGDVYKKDDTEDDLKSVCMLDFLDMNELWGTADWASQVMKDHDFTVFGYLEAEVVFSPGDTWNWWPARSSSPSAVRLFSGR